MFSVHYPGTAVDEAAVRAVAAAVEQFPQGRLWMGQSLAVDPHQVFVFCAGLGYRFPFGTSVSLMPLRHPVDAALQARSLVRLSGSPVVAGYGPGGLDLQRHLLGAPYTSQLEAVERYARTMRESDGGLDGVELGLGVLRPAMARLAGRVADVAITWLCPPGYIRDTLLPEIRHGAAAAGRKPPRLAAVVHVAPAGPRRDPVDYAHDISSRHLAAPHYVAMLRRAGLDVDPARTREGARLLVESGCFVHGDGPGVVAGLDAYRRAGVDEVVVNLSAVAQHRGPLVAARELGRLAAELHRLPAVTA